MFKGVETRFTYEGVEKVNTAYTFLFDGIRVCVLGAVQEKLSGEVRDALGECDMLILPVLEGESLNYLSPHAAEAVAVALEAKVVIPVGHNDKTLPIFLKEAGATSVQPLEKLTIKKKEVDSKSGEVVTLQEI
jgi:L-ascorbate metabolism protein UlaG (beta-lactamase superfamily)